MDLGVGQFFRCIPRHGVTIQQRSAAPQLRAADIRYLLKKLPTAALALVFLFQIGHERFEVLDECTAVHFPLAREGF